MLYTITVLLLSLWQEVVVAPVLVAGPWVGVAGLARYLDPPLEGRGDELVVEDALQNSERQLVLSIRLQNKGLMNLRAGHLLLCSGDLCGCVVEDAGQFLKAARE